MLAFWVPVSVSGDTLERFTSPALAGQRAKVLPFREAQPYVPVPEGVNPVVLGFGSKVLKFLQTQGMAPKNRSLTSMRGQVIEHNGAKILLTWDPGIVWQEDPKRKKVTGYARLWEIQWDVRLAMRLDKTGSLETPTGNYKDVDDFMGLIRLIEKAYEKYQKPIPCACDLETVGLDPYNPERWIVAITFTVRPGESWVKYFTSGMNQPMRPGPEGSVEDSGELWEQISWLLNSSKVSTVGANFKYDMSWLWSKWRMGCRNFKRDTILIGSLLDENRANSVNVQAKIFTDMGGYDDSFNREFDKSKMHEVPRARLVAYAGGDSDAEYKIDRQLLPMLKRDRRLANFYLRLVHPVARVYEKIECQGVHVDVDYYLKLQKTTARYIRAKHRQLLKSLPRKLQLKYSDNLSLTRPAIIKDFLFGKRWLGLEPQRFTDTGEPSTNKEHLALFKDHPEAGAWVTGLREWKQGGKVHDSYIVGFLSHLRADGRFHPTYYLAKQEDDEGEEAGTNTGRTSAKDPAWQTMPKHNPIWTPRLRRAFIAPPGYVVLSADYDQGELKMTAELANDPAMLNFYIKGGRDADLHKLTAAMVAGYTFEDFLRLESKKQKPLRQKGKAFNFGLIYGMMAKGFVRYAKDIYGVDFTLAEAEKAIAEFFGLYRRLPEWHEEQKEHARTYGWVRNPLGRVRHLPLIKAPDFKVAGKQERRAINAPVQSGLSDLTQLAIVELDRRYGMVPFEMTHDNLKFYVLEADVPRDAARVLEVMEALPTKELFGWEPRVTFTAGLEVGPNLAELEPLSI